MTFDEEINKYKNFSYESYGLYPIYTNEYIYMLLEELKQEYAPTIEMTQEQVDELNSIVREVGGVFEPNEIPADVKLTDKVIELESSYILFKYLNAILHPETIKIVDKEEKL